jgi:hypothetical protein
VQHRLAERLNDESPALRVQAARLLDELNYDMAGTLIAERLQQETSPAVVSDLLDVLVRRPVSAAAAPARKWLAEPEVADEAADLLFRICAIGPLGDDMMRDLRIDARNILQQRSNRSAVRLLALIGDDHDLTRCNDLLDDDDPVIREAVADGYCQRGLRQPLIDRSHDSAIHSQLIRVLTEGAVDLTALRTLVNLKVVESNLAMWQEGMAKAISKLPPADLIAADDLLAANSHINGNLRQALLARAIAMPREELAADRRTIAVSRLAPMLMEQGDAIRAYALLDGMPLENPTLKSLYFRAAALSGQYEKASEIRKEPRAWVELLTTLAEKDLTAAGALCKEIERRFAGRLSEEDQAIVDEVNESVRQSQSASATLN